MAKGPTEFKTISPYGQKVDEEQGMIECLVTTFGILDAGGDISHPGSFAKTITERGNKVKILDKHRSESIRDIVGKPLKIWEVDKNGLPDDVKTEYPQATGGTMAQIQFFMETDEGKGAFVRAKNRAVELSYGYDALDVDYTTMVNDEGKEIDARNLRSVRLWEISLVPWGMNPATQTLSAKNGDEDIPNTTDEVAEELEKQDEEPEEAKVEVTENYIRIPADTGDHSGHRIRTKTLSADKGIKALYCGECKKIITYLFDKDKWELADAKKWVADHKKESAKAIESLTDRVDRIHGAVSDQLNTPSDRYRLYASEVFDDVVIVRDNQTEAYWKIDYSMDDEGNVSFANRAEWIEGDMVFTPKELAIDVEALEKELDILGLEIEELEIA